MVAVAVNGNGVDSGRWWDCAPIPDISKVGPVEVSQVQN